MGYPAAAFGALFLVATTLASLLVTVVLFGVSTLLDRTGVRALTAASAVLTALLGAAVGWGVASAGIVHSVTQVRYEPLLVALVVGVVGAPVVVGGYIFERVTGVFGVLSG